MSDRTVKLDELYKLKQLCTIDINDSQNWQLFIAGLEMIGGGLTLFRLALSLQDYHIIPNELFQVGLTSTISTAIVGYWFLDTKRRDFKRTENSKITKRDNINIEIQKAETTQEDIDAAYDEATLENFEYEMFKSRNKTLAKTM